MIGISASLSALQLLPRLRLRLMEQIGGSSYPIYLYHPVFVAAAFAAVGTRIPLPTSLLFVIAGAVGLMGPMLLEQASRADSARTAAARGQHGTEAAEASCRPGLAGYPASSPIALSRSCRACCGNFSTGSASIISIRLLMSCNVSLNARRLVASSPWTPAGSSIPQWATTG